jgi:hypothetical protein
MWYGTAMEKGITPLSSLFNGIKRHPIIVVVSAVFAAIAKWGELQSVEAAMSGLLEHFLGPKWSFSDVIDSPGFVLFWFIVLLGSVYWSGNRALKEERRQGDLNRKSRQAALEDVKKFIGRAPEIFNKGIAVEHLRTMKTILQSEMSYHLGRFENIANGATNEVLSNLSQLRHLGGIPGRIPDKRIPAILSNYDDFKVQISHPPAQEAARDRCVVPKHLQHFCEEYEKMIEMRRPYERAMRRIDEKISELQQEIWEYGEQSG